MVLIRNIFPYKGRQKYIDVYTHNLQYSILLALNYTETGDLRFRLIVAFKHHITDRFTF